MYDVRAHAHSRPPSRPWDSNRTLPPAEKRGAHLKCLMNAKSPHFSWHEDGWAFRPQSTLRVDRRQDDRRHRAGRRIGERQAELVLSKNTNEGR
jgi:hypothetical protein